MVPFRGTGIFIVVWVALAWLVAGFFFEARTVKNPSFGAWFFLSAMLLSALQSLYILATYRKVSHGAQKRSIWHDTFALIPVLIWPLIFAGGSIYYFTR